MKKTVCRRGLSSGWRKTGDTWNRERMLVAIAALVLATPAALVAAVEFVNTLEPKRGCVPVRLFSGRKICLG